MSHLLQPGDPRDLSADTDPRPGEIGYHDGTGDGLPSGLYFFDGSSSQWVKVSASSISGSTTISI